MNPITSPLTPQMQGAAVADLQDALLQCLIRGALLANDPRARRDLTIALRPEPTRQTYADATVKLVGTFQSERSLRPTGEVDAATAALLNALLREWGLLDDVVAPTGKVVTGAVRREDRLPLVGLRVRAVHDARFGAIRLGEDATDQQGPYTIRYDSLPGVDVVTLGVIAVAGDGTFLASASDIRDPKPLETIDLTIPIRDAVARPQRIEGTILMEHGAPADQLTLRLYRRDFGGKN